VVGDTDSDPELMAQLGAKKVYRLGNTFAEYITDWPSRLVLNQLSQFGFRVICEFFFWEFVGENVKMNEF
jgi:hypothetical protein